MDCELTGEAVATLLENHLPAMIRLSGSAQTLTKHWAKRDDSGLIEISFYNGLTIDIPLCLLKATINAMSSEEFRLMSQAEPAPSPTPTSSSLPPA